MASSDVALLRSERLFGQRFQSRCAQASSIDIVAVKENVRDAFETALAVHLIEPVRDDWRENLDRVGLAFESNQQRRQSDSKVDVARIERDCVSDQRLADFGWMAALLGVVTHLIVNFGLLRIQNARLPTSLHGQPRRVDRLQSGRDSQQLRTGDFARRRDRHQQFLGKVVSADGSICDRQFNLDRPRKRLNQGGTFECIDPFIEFAEAEAGHAQQRQGVGVVRILGQCVLSKLDRVSEATGLELEVSDGE